ncbi:MAG TPA: phosphoribosylpyrophosphate synthetase, partial [Quisquiliibacterium sp.]|nr:phosphoribosylpyrophosphate synthetase [Quisquiliibacterium sp.]
RKVRLGDRSVQVLLPADLPLSGRAVVLIDDMASTGHTLAIAARQCLDAGAASVDVAVTHALFVDDAQDLLVRSGVRHVWSTDCVPHTTSAISVVPLIAAAVRAAAGDEARRVGAPGISAP